MPVELTVPRSDIDIAEENVRLTSDLRTMGNIVKHSAQIDVTGRIEGTGEIDCTRCLSPIARELDVEFQVAAIAQVFIMSQLAAACCTAVKFLI